MALNIKNAEVERLATLASELAQESKTEAIRVALSERVARLRLYRGKQTRAQRIAATLADFRREFPRAPFGKRLTKRQEEELLGIGEEGV